MQPVSKLKIKKVKNGKKFDFEDTLIKEKQIEIYVNGDKAVSMMATPVDLEPLAVGYLISEGVIKRYGDIKSVKTDKESFKIDIKADINAEKLKNLNENGVIVSGCGKSVTSNISQNPEEIDAFKIKSEKTLPPRRYPNRCRAFTTHAPWYELTGCGSYPEGSIFENGTYFEPKTYAQIHIEKPAEKP